MKTFARIGAQQIAKAAGMLSWCTTGRLPDILLAPGAVSLKQWEVVACVYLFCSVTQDHAALLHSGSRHGASTRARRGLDWRTESQQRRSRERGAALERPWGGAGGSMREPRPYYYRVQVRPLDVVPLLEHAQNVPAVLGTKCDVT